MHFVLIGDDHTDPGAPARRIATRPRHIENLIAWAKAGKLILSGPRMPDDATTTGSLQFFDVADRAEMDAYLAVEPFQQDGVWEHVNILPFRVAPLPYPAPPAPGEAPIITWAIIAMDGTDAGAEARRTAARPAHLENLQPLLAAGRFRLGGAILDAPEGRMVGSIMAVTAPDEATARALAENDAYSRAGVWQHLRVERWRVGPQPYKKLPGQP
jgi:uncharacterized protein YciI